MVGRYMYMGQYWLRFLVLQAQQSCDYLHRFVLVHVQSCKCVQNQENTPISLDLFPSLRVGSGNETIEHMPVLEYVQSSHNNDAHRTQQPSTFKKYIYIFFLDQPLTSTISLHNIYIICMVSQTLHR